MNKLVLKWFSFQVTEKKFEKKAVGCLPFLSFEFSLSLSLSRCLAVSLSPTPAFIKTEMMNRNNSGCEKTRMKKMQQKFLRRKKKRV